MSVSLEYFFEGFDRTEVSGEEAFVNVGTRKLAVGLRYFSRPGAIAHLKVVQIGQKGDFLIRGRPTHGEDNFWVADAAIGYRIPKRFGRLTFEVRNLFNTTFQFQDTDPGNPTITPGRLAVLRFTIGV
jgi:outer membrane receptor protein involved in Fe transport